MPQYNLELGLSDDALMRIAEPLEAPLQKGYLVQTAAGIYWAITTQGSQATGRGTKADLRRAAKDLKRAADALENLPLQTSLFASLAKVDGRVAETGFMRRQRAILPELRWMQELMENWGAGRRRAIPDQDLPMSAALVMLDEVYRATTGQQPTHSYHRDGAGVSSGGSDRRLELAMHPTVKPVAMIADALRDCSHRGDIVLDNFGGSGSTLIAAEKCGRRARLIELDPIYCDTIVRRFEALSGKIGALVNGI